eukprot:TRINITY_DN14230_c0_g1_i1.p1 TRINITY_DN14230_c0_g1~~TRINITY_DN14230_c0_g1_i1.p1  ORF type:complete len:82 (-),score=7.01 TRINITY_DN14230_c0_g1_i1:210-455(-)
MSERLSELARQLRAAQNKGGDDSGDEGPPSPVRTRRKHAISESYANGPSFKELTKANENYRTRVIRLPSALLSGLGIKQGT